MNQEIIIETYYDHYKETYNLNKEFQSYRNRNYVLLCILEGIAFMMIWNPDLICGILNDTARNELKIAIQISNSILQTLNWFFILYILVRYIQNTLYIERGYLYIDKLEKQIQLLLNEDETNTCFNREGKNYLQDYPIVLNLIDLFYKLLSPLAFTTINSVHIWFEWGHRNNIVAFCCDLLVFIATTILTVLFIIKLYTHSSTQKQLTQQQKETI